MGSDYDEDTILDMTRKLARQEHEITRLRTDRHKWKKMFALLCKATNKSKWYQALAFYADPATYFAIGFFPDPPCGEFMDDFADDHGDPQLEGERPGKRARAALGFTYTTRTRRDYRQCFEPDLGSEVWECMPFAEPPRVCEGDCTYPCYRCAKRIITPEAECFKEGSDE